MIGRSHRLSSRLNVKLKKLVRNKVDRQNWVGPLRTSIQYGCKSYLRGCRLLVQKFFKKWSASKIDQSSQDKVGPILGLQMTKSARISWISGPKWGPRTTDGKITVWARPKNGLTKIQTIFLVWPRPLFAHLCSGQLNYGPTTPVNDVRWPWDPAWIRLGLLLIFVSTKITFRFYFLWFQKWETKLFWK